MLVQNRLNGFPIPGRGRNDAAGAEDRFADEGGDGVRAFTLDQRLKLGRAMGDEFGFALAEVFAAEVIRGDGVGDLLDREVEFLVEEFQPGQRSGYQPRAVIAAPARDDLFLFRQAADVVVIPDQLDVGFVRVRPAEAEIDFGHVVGRAVEDHFGEGDRRFGAVADIGMVISQFAGLIGNGLGDFLTAIADVHAVKPGKGIEQLRAVAIFDMDTRCSPDHPVGAFAARVLGKMSRGVEKVFSIPLIQLIVLQHIGSFSCEFRVTPTGFAADQPSLCRDFLFRETPVITGFGAIFASAGLGRAPKNFATLRNLKEPEARLRCFLPESQMGVLAE